LATRKHCGGNTGGGGLSHMIDRMLVYISGSKFMVRIS